MYNKLFTKILDSSIWLAPDHTRLVWITFLAVMDQDGFVQMATVGNVAARAMVSLERAHQAIKELESPEPATANEHDDGTRIERVPGGWMVLNAQKYREMVTRVVVREQTRERMRKYRANKSGDADVTQALRESDGSTSVSDHAPDGGEGGSVTLPFSSPEFASAWADWEQHRKEKRKKLTPLSVTKQFKALTAMGEARAIAAIEYSIEKGWDGIFEQKGQNNGTHSKPAGPCLRARGTANENVAGQY